MTQTAATAQDRYAPPRAHVEDVEIQEGLDPLLAGRGRRLAAAIIDATLWVAILSLVGWLFPWNPWAGTRGTALAFNTAIGFVGFLAMHGWLLVNRGQTLGKAAMRVRILSKDGSRATARQLLVMRYGLGTALALIPIAGNVYSLIDALLIFRASRRCLHDVIAGTIVVPA